jgi:hypothetical protein
MVEDQDTPYWSIVGHVLVAASDDQEEYIRVVTLIAFEGYREWKCGFCSYDKGRVGTWDKESRIRGMIVHYLQIRSHG